MRVSLQRPLSLLAHVRFSNHGKGDGLYWLKNAFITSNIQRLVYFKQLSLIF